MEPPQGFNLTRLSGYGNIERRREA